MSLLDFLQCLHQMVLKLLFSCCHDISPPNPLEGADQPDKREMMKLMKLMKEDEVDRPQEKEDDLNPADDGEPSEEPHGATDEAQLALCLDLLVSLDVIEGRCVKVDLNQLKGRMR